MKPFHKTINHTRAQPKRLHADPTHLILHLFIHAGFQQQPHAVRMTLLSGTHQRRPSALRVSGDQCTAVATAAASYHTRAHPPMQTHADANNNNNDDDDDDNDDNDDKADNAFS